MLRLAREIAKGIHPLETILKAYGADAARWEEVRNHPNFVRLLESEIEAWSSAANTHERVKLKAAVMVEEWLEELNSRLHDPREKLSDKIEGGKLAAKLAGMGINQADIAAMGEKFSVVINMGSGQDFRFEREVNPSPPAIEAEAV
jgi:hypothetical protein